MCYMGNITPDTEAAQDGLGGDAFRVERNCCWGWFVLGGTSFSFIKSK